MEALFQSQLDRLGIIVACLKFSPSQAERVIPSCWRNGMLCDGRVGVQPFWTRVALQTQIIIDACLESAARDGAAVTL
jgi:hypothetical protein